MKHLLLPFLLLCLLWSFASAVACEVAEGSDPSASTAEKFFELEAAKAQLDFDALDHILLSEAILHATNEQRQGHGLSELEPLPELVSAACKHAKDMIEQDFFAHENPHAIDRRTPLDRVQNEGLQVGFVAENIAQTFGIQYESGEPVYPRQENGRTVFAREPGGEPIEVHDYASFARALLNSWMKSEGHRQNILSKAPSHLGAACVHEQDEAGIPTFTCVQLFFSPLPGH